MLQQSGLWLREPCIDYYILKTAAVSTGFFSVLGHFYGFSREKPGKFPAGKAPPPRLPGDSALFCQRRGVLLRQLQLGNDPV
jgi:hypothetical protein